MPGQEDSARCTLQEKEDRKGVGGSTKGCFNRLLSSVAEQEEEKVTPPVRNYLAACRECETEREGERKEERLAACGNGGGRQGDEKGNRKGARAEGRSGFV